MSRSRQKGTFFETLVKTYFQSCGLDAERIALQGKYDVGDLRVRDIDAVFELKNCAKLELGKWIRETEVERENAKARWGFTIFKRRGKGLAEDQYVLMTVGQLIDILGEVNPGAFKEI